MKTGRLRRYLRDNLVAGLKTSPFKAPFRAWVPLILYAPLAWWVGRSEGLLEPGMLGPPHIFWLPVTLFIFPTLLEEGFFRGILIPRDTADLGWRRIIMAVTLSTALFVLWHPLNALTVNPGALPIFSDPHFLLVTTLLGLACSISYILSRSLWHPLLIHWLTVVVWVIFSGGRNLILEF